MINAQGYRLPTQHELAKNLTSREPLSQNSSTSHRTSDLPAAASSERRLLTNWCFTSRTMLGWSSPVISAASNGRPSARISMSLTTFTATAFPSQKPR